MSARAVITMSPEQYLAGLKQLEAATAKSSNKMENSFQNYERLVRLEARLVLWGSLSGANLET